MRLIVDGGSYLAAATAFRSGNQFAALQCDALAGRLAAYGGMAGNDATSIDFARSYDVAAAEALQALADLSASFITLGRLTRASEHHHRRADDAAAAQFAVSAYTGGNLHEDDYVRVSTTSPPTTLGAQEPGLGPVETWILDRIEGFVWPGADTDRLRAAATTWRRAAEGVSHLLDHCDRACDGLAAQRSPEIPLALDAVDELRSAIRDIAAHLAALAGACEEYAAHVEEARARTLALLAEIAQMVVEGMVVSAAIGLITGGTATGAVAGATVARVVAQAPRFRAILEALRASTAVVAGRVRAAHEGALTVRARLEKFLHLELRNERGATRLTGAGRYASRRSGWLAAHHSGPGHPLDHVARSTDELLERNARLNLPRSSSFNDQDSAEHLIGRALDSHGDEISAWRRSEARDKLVVDLDTPHTTGITVDRRGDIAHPTGVRVVLIPDSTMPDGWRILTAFPN